MNNATMLGDPCCAACAQGKPCDSEKPKTACCEACAQGKPCTGACAEKPKPLGVVDFDIDKAEIAQFKRRPDLWEPPSDLDGSERTLWMLWMSHPDLAVHAARTGHPVAQRALDSLPVAVLRQAEAYADSHPVVKRAHSERSEPASSLGAADGRGNWCPPGMRAVRTPAAVPNRFICVTDPTQTLGAWHPDLLQMPRPADQAAYDQFVWERASRTLSGAASDVDPVVRQDAEAKRVLRNRILAGTAGAVCGIAAAWVGVRLYTKQPIVPAAVKAKAQMATEKVKKVFK